MGTTTWGNARAAIARELGFVSFATTQNLTTDTHVHSTELTDDYPENGTFNGWFVKILTGNNAGTVRRVTSYVAAQGRCVVSGANFVSESGAVDVELHRFHPDRLTTLFNEATTDLFPYVSKYKDVQTLVTGFEQHNYTVPSSVRGRPSQVWFGNYPAMDDANNVVVDGGFESWTNPTTPTSWTIAGTDATVNQESQTNSEDNYVVYEDQYSARVYSASSGETTLLQTVTPNAGTQGVEVNLSIWVYSNTAARVTARINSTDSTAHTGTGWEVLKVSTVLGATATNFTVGVACSAGTQISFFVDGAVVSLGQSEVMDRAWEPVSNWRYYPPTDGASVATLYIPVRPSNKRVLRIVGKAPLSSVTNDADTIEVDGENASVVYDKTRELVCNQLAVSGGIEARDFWQAKSAEYANKVTRWLIERGGANEPAPRVRIPDM